MSDNIPDKEIRQVVEKIFYSPATNGKAEQSINDGIEAVDKLFEAARHHQSPVTETDRDIADLIVYTVTECNANGDSYTVTKDKVAELFKRWHNELSHLEHPSSLTGDAVEFANYLHNNRWMPLDGYDRWEQEESKSVTSTEQLYKLFLSRDH